MVINTNQNAVDAASVLQRSQAALNRSLARLSSGTKITDPSDDAAGLAVTEKLQAQNSRIQAARVNAQNTVSLLQTADGFLTKMSDVLNRMSELSILALDTTKNASDVALYGIEFEQLKEHLRDVIGNGPNGTDSDPNWNTSSTDPAGAFNGISLFGARADMVVVTGSSGGHSMTIGAINLREIGSAMSNLLWDNSVDAGQANQSVDTSGVVDLLNNALEQVAQERARLGSVLSRVDVIESQLQVEFQNLEAATSRIRDVDVAEESTNFSKYNILVQSGTAMLGQANALPQSVLRLLG